MRDDRPAALVLVGGHESDGGRGLAAPAQTDVPTCVAAPGRTLAAALDAAQHDAGDDRPVVVVPMTLGRDPQLVSDIARTVAWATRDRPSGALAVSAPFGASDHLVGWLRAACRQVGEDTAVLVAADPANAFDDAELYRVVALTRAYGTHSLVEVGLRSRAHGLRDGLWRCRALGAERVAVVSAVFGDAPDVDVALLSPAAIATVVRARVSAACHRLRDHGDDGVAVALRADHAAGFAHSHADDDHHHPHHHHDHTHAPAAAAAG